MLVSVLLKEKQFFISCGPATQPASWLAHVACLRYDTSLGQHIGPPAALQRADGNNIHDWSLPIHQCVADGEQLVVVMRRGEEGQLQQKGDEEYKLIRPIRDEEENEQEEEEEDGEEGWQVEEGRGGVEDDGGNAAMQSDSSDSDDEVHK